MLLPGTLGVPGHLRIRISLPKVLYGISLWLFSHVLGKSKHVRRQGTESTGEIGKTEQELEQPCSEEGVLPMLAAQKVIS